MKESKIIYWLGLVVFIVGFVILNEYVEPMIAISGLLISLGWHATTAHVYLEREEKRLDDQLEHERAVSNILNNTLEALKEIKKLKGLENE